MRLLALAIGLLLAALACAAGGIAGNAPPLGDPPGVLIRLDAYLTTHVAETREGSAFPELRPRRYALGPAALFAKVREAVARLPRWEVVETTPDRRTLRAVVTSRLLGFRDDVQVRVLPEPGRSVVLIRAASRVGRGDLGANARHIRDLHAMLEEMAITPL